MSKSLFGTRNYYKPFDYSVFFDIWSKQSDMFWLPHEIPFHMDNFDFYKIITSDERQILTNVFKIFTHTDFCVSQGYMLLLNYFDLYEIKAMIVAFLHMETIHAEAYSQLIEKLKLSPELHKEFKKAKELNNKHDFMQWPEIKNDLDLLRTIAHMSIFIEGFVLFSSFVILLNLPRFGLMKGVGQLTTLSMRDETLHYESMRYLFLAVEKELLMSKQITSSELHCLKCQLNKDLEVAISNEIEMINYIFNVKDNVDMYKMRGINSADVIHYVINLANVRAASIGLTLPCQYKKYLVPYPEWMNQSVNLREFVDFFAQRHTEYQKVNTSDLSESDFY